MAIGVVDLLEVIHIDQGQRHRLLALHGATEQGLGGLNEGPAVVDPGESIHLGEPQQLRNQPQPQPQHQPNATGHQRQQASQEHGEREYQRLAAGLAAVGHGDQRGAIAIATHALQSQRVGLHGQQLLPADQGQRALEHQSLPGEAGQQGRGGGALPEQGPQLGLIGQLQHMGDGQAHQRIVGGSQYHTPLIHHQRREHRPAGGGLLQLPLQVVERRVAGEAAAELTLHRRGRMAQLARTLIQHHHAGHHGHQGRRRHGGEPHLDPEALVDPPAQQFGLLAQLCPDPLNHEGSRKAELSTGSGASGRILPDLSIRSAMRLRVLARGPFGASRARC